MANAWVLRPNGIAAVTTTGTTVGTPGNLANDYMGVIWSASAATMSGSGPYFQSIVVDMGADVTIDTILLLGLANDAPAGTTMLITAATAAQGIGSNARWNSGTYVPLYAGSVSLVSEDQAALWSAPATGGPPACRYWEIVISSPSRWTVRARRVVLGIRLNLERNFSFGLTAGVRDLGSLDFSARGVLLRRQAKRLRTLSLTFSNLRKDEVEYQLSRFLEAVGNTDCIALVTDPSADPMRTPRTYYGPLVGDLGSVWRKANLWESKINMVSIF